MNPIETYLDNIFYGLPQNEEMGRARRRMQESMEEKFEGLRREGKSESEALGIVVSEFGSVSELLRELGQSTLHQGTTGPGRTVFPEEEYLSFRKKFGVAMAAGVCLCILGVALGGIAGSFENTSTLTILAFFGPIAMGVALFIYFGTQEERYEELKKASGWGEYQGVVYETRRVRARVSHPVVEAINGIVMLLATVVFLILGFTMGLWHPGWVVFPVGGILCGMVSIIGGIWGG